MGRALFLAVFATLAYALPASAGRCGGIPCRADVGISGHVESQPIRVGETSEIKLTAMNNGEASALAIDLQANVPAGLEIVSANHFGGRSCSVKGQFVQCDLGDFTSQQQAVVRIKVKGNRAGTFLTEAKVYASDIEDPNGGNAQITTTLLVQEREGGTSTEGGSSSGGGGSSSGGGSSVTSGTTTYGLTSDLRTAFRQRMLKSGGVKATVRAKKSGKLSVRGQVSTPSGIVRLSPVTRSVRSGSTTSIFLGTTNSALSRIRTALRSRSSLRATVWARVGGRTTRRDLVIVR